MTYRKLAHSLEAEARQRPVRHAEPFSVNQRREGWRLLRDLLLASIAFAFLAVAYVAFLADGR